MCTGVGITNRKLLKYQRVKIVYYSGTGGTARVAECYSKIFREAGCDVHMQQLKAGLSFQEEKHDLLVLVFAVHACNAPQPVYTWIKNSLRVNGVPAVVISVSGGGEVIPNTACRASCIRKLQKKGYEVIYERMFVMPSNWIVATKEPLALQLLEVMPMRVNQVVYDVLSGVQRRTRPLLVDRFFSWIGELEKFGARSMGKYFKVSDACNGCGWCSKNCPAGNIEMKGVNPKFGCKCNLCMKCIYGCHQKALVPGIGRFIQIKEGYSLESLEKKLPCTEPVDVEKLAKGYLCSGVRKYLLQEG